MNQSVPRRGVALSQADGFGGHGARMNREELAARLERDGIPAAWYHLYGAHFEDRHVIDHRANGWFVFFTERGDEWGHARFETEAGACAGLLSRLHREQASGRDG